VTMAEGLLAQGLTTSRASTFAAPERLGPMP
jgi:allantoin racemase